MSKSNKRILVVGTYPIKNPSHGGQKRLDAIVNEYRRVFQEVRYVSIFFKDFYSDYSSDDIPLGHESEQLVRQSPLTGDIICGEAIYKDRTVKAKFTAVLKELSPDIIHVEQPFAYAGIKPLLKELGIHPKIVFGSQNIEGPMKEEILIGYGVATADAHRFNERITRLENEFSKECDLLVACTASDLKAHEQMGAKSCVLASNGVSEYATNPKDEKYWRDLFGRMGVTSTAVFVGSAHPPNWAGFLSMIGKGLGFVPPASRIVAAGSISDYFEREISENSLDIQDVTFWKRAYSAGRLSEPRLRAIISTADVLLLPITEGGGSNLKTAEAILADKKVVATSHALRSFEWFSDYPNVWVADKPEEFRNSIIEALQTDRKQRSKEQAAGAQRVTWKNCLVAMISEVEKL